MLDLSCIFKSYPNNNSVGSSFAEHKGLNSGLCYFNKKTYDNASTIAVISATICAIVCISDFFFNTSVKIFRAHGTALGNDFCSVANLISPFLWLEDIILRSSELNNGIDKGQLLGGKNVLGDLRSEITADNFGNFCMKSGAHFTLILKFLNLIKIHALHTHRVIVTVICF